MTTPTHIRAWVAINAVGEMDLETISKTKATTETYIHANHEHYKYAAPITIVRGHDLADQLEKETATPKSKFHWENGTKVYESYEDYCND